MENKRHKYIPLLAILVALCNTWPIFAKTQSFNFTFNRQDFKVETIDSITSIEASTGDYMATYTPGWVALPFRLVRIVIPQGNKEASFTFSTTTELAASNVYMPKNELPSLTSVLPQSAPSLTSEIIPTEDDAIENHDNVAVRALSTNAIQNGVAFCEYAIKPFVYDAAKRKLYFVSQVTLNVNYEPDNNVSELPILADRFSTDRVTNINTLETYIHAEATTRAGTTEMDEFDYAIITSESLAPAFDEMVRWKNMKGVRTRVFTMEEVRNTCKQYNSGADKLKDFLKNLYSKHHIQYALLGGDSDIVPAKMCHMTFDLKDGISEDTFPTDLYYACFDGDILWNSSGSVIQGCQHSNIDLTPEIYVGRLPLNNPIKIANYCKKCVRFETELFDDNYYNSYLFGGEVIDASYDLGSDTYYKALVKINGYMSSYCDTSNKNIYKLFNYFGWEKADALYYNKMTFQDVISNNEILLMNLDCHGSQRSLNIFKSTSPIDTEPLNGDIFKHLKYPVFFITEACNTNQFTFSQCLSSQIIGQDIGCYAYIGSTTFGFFNSDRKNPISYSSSVTACLLENLFNHDSEFCYNAIGPQLYNAKKKGLVGGGNHNIEKALMMSISLMGDPNLVFYTQTPTRLKGIIKANDNNLKITVPNAPEIYWLTLTQGNKTERYVMGNQGEKEITISYNMEPYTIVAYANNSLPWIYKPSTFNILYLHDIEITQDVKYIARKTIIGGNVKVADGANLEIVSKEGFEIRDNVVCGEGATFKYSFQ